MELNLEYDQKGQTKSVRRLLLPGANVNGVFPRPTPLKGSSRHELNPHDHKKSADS